MRASESRSGRGRAVVFEEPGQVEVRSVDPPMIAPGEVVVRVAWAGICGSDLDLRDGHRPAPYARYPIVPGHEWSGVVEAVGDGVDRSWLDQPVVGENIRPCARCAPCGLGAVLDCETGYDETGFTIDGAWADLVVVPAALLHRLPAGADLRSAAGIEPAACAAEAIRRAELAEGERVAIVGGGTIGLLCAQLVRRSASELVVVDPDATKVVLARQCGVDRVIGPEAVGGEFEGRFDLVIEAAGVIGTAALSVTLARRGGRVVLLGIPPAADSVNTLALVAKRLELVTVFGGVAAGVVRRGRRVRRGAPRSRATRHPRARSRRHCRGPRPRRRPPGRRRQGAAATMIG